MKRREFSLASLSTAAALGGLSLNNTAFAQGPAKFVAGKDYTKLDRAVPTETEAGKIEVIEFFWYSCSHCNAFEPAFAQWVKMRPRMWWCAACLWLLEKTSRPSNACIFLWKPWAC